MRRPSSSIKSRNSGSRSREVRIISSITSRGEAEFLENLRNVFERFRLKNLRLKAKKCRFGLKRIEYVGRVIDKDGVTRTAVQLYGYRRTFGSDRGRSEPSDS